MEIFYGRRKCMKKIKIRYLLPFILIIISIIFTILVKTIDVKNIGPNGSRVGFAYINKYLFELIGVNMIWYHITDWLGIIPVLLAIFYACLGFYQLITRKSLFKVDKEIVFLGILYLILIGIYLFFENIIVNSRPILINGYLEASYPSSHTLMALTLCGSSIMINKKLYTNIISKMFNIISIVIISLTVIGRIISGVHWFTDILGGIIISITLLSLYNLIIKCSKIVKN
jgi:undecaprenyl-diphosphatase